MEKDLHISEVPSIEWKDILHKSDYCFLDTRAQIEFAEGSLPFAYNIPLLDNEERVFIGLTFKQAGQKNAIDEGYKILEQKQNAILSQFFLLPKFKYYAVFCARGGMRSRIITALLRKKGIQAIQVEGGYKQFRKYLNTNLPSFVPPKLVVLHGYTGSGKTRILQHLHNMIDLEAHAGHRGSLFGGIGIAQKTQKNFEASLFCRLLQLNQDKVVYIEGESRKIGKVNIPSVLYQKMRESVSVHITANLRGRAYNILEEYLLLQPKEIPTIRKIITRLEKPLGKTKLAHLLYLFDTKDYLGCFCRLLELYYDPKYRHTLKTLTPVVRFSSHFPNPSQTAFLMERFFVQYPYG